MPIEAVVGADGNSLAGAPKLSRAEPVQVRSNQVQSWTLPLGMSWHTPFVAAAVQGRFRARGQSTVRHFGTTQKEQPSISVAIVRVPN